MALLGAYTVGSGTAVQLSTLVPASMKQLDIKANAANGASVFIGGSDVTSAGVNAWIELEAGDSWGAKAEEGEELRLELGNAYIIGTASDKIHISYIR